MTCRIRGALAPALAIVCVAAAGAKADASKTWDLIFGGQLPSTPPAVDYLDVDGFDTPAGFVAAGKANGTAMICYVSAGTVENWRPDHRAFVRLDREQRARGRPAIIGRKYSGWRGERWLNLTRYRVFLPLMVKRIELCKRKGFEMIDFDNFDGYATRTGFRIRKRHAVRYATALAKKARRLGLVSVQKNVTELSRRLEPHFGALLLEDCVLYGFCADAARYRDAGKPVFDVEYPQAWASEGKSFDLVTACAETNADDIALVVKNLDLDTWVQRCP